MLLSLDVRCDDAWQTARPVGQPVAPLLAQVLPCQVLPYWRARLGHYLLLMLGLGLTLALLMGMLYYLEWR